MSRLGAVPPNPALQVNRCHSYVALDCVKKDASKQDEGEDITVELHPHAGVPRLVMEGHITHALVMDFFLERLRAEAQR